MKQFGKNGQQLLDFVRGDEKWNSRSSSGQAFYLKHKNDATWKALTDPAEIQHFRQTWAKKELAHQINQKRYTKSFQRVDTTKGEYLPVEKVVEAEGGWERAASRRAGLLHVRKCFEMKAPWISYNGMTERYDVLYLRKEWRA